MKRLFVLFALFLFSSLSVNAQKHDHEHNQKIDFPDVPGYLTLAADFHIHTVFSDGAVWPTVRVQEAIREGLDVIAMTDHLEYQPKKDDIPHPDRNRSFQIALDAAKNSNLMVINGSEITRSMPPGHTNAVFISDANPILTEDVEDAFQAAKDQDAFIFWNHPMWSAQRKDGVARLDPLHEKFIREGKLHGIEVINVKLYSDEALQIAIDNNLTIMGTSDIHGLTDWDFNIPHGGHRSVTLVFAEDRTQESVKAALKAGRTVVYANEGFIGLEEHMMPLMRESIKVKSASYRGDTQILAVDIENVTHSDIIIKNESEYNLHEHTEIVVLKAQDTTRIQIKTLERKDQVTFPIMIMNATTAPDTHPVLELDVEVE